MLFLGKTALISLNLDVRGKVSFIALAGYCRLRSPWTVPVADIILNDKYRSHAALLRTDNGTEVGVVNFSSFKPT